MARARNWRMRAYSFVTAVSKLVRVSDAGSSCKKCIYAFSRFAMYKAVSHPTSRDVIWFPSDTAACRLKRQIGRLEFRREDSYLEQQANADPRQAGMHRVNIDNNIAHLFNSVQPTYHLVRLLFQNEFSASKCNPPPLLQAVALLLAKACSSAKLTSLEFGSM